MLDILNEHRSHKLNKYLEGNDMVFKCLDCDEILFIVQNYENQISENLKVKGTENDKLE